MNSNKNQKSILFLSGIDFKEKSIQVIRKTPEAYAEKAWMVDYVVGRDNNPKGNYYYEEEINPKKVNVFRFYWPFAKLRAQLIRPLFLLFNKMVSFFVVLKLFFVARRLLKSKSYDVIYGYEILGIHALKLLELFGLVGNAVTVSRIQGTFLNEMLENKQVLRLIFNLDLILAIRFRTDILIMTNDGTQGDKAFKKIRGLSSRFVFWVNGVDKFNPDINEVEILKQKFKSNDDFIFLSVSRLVGWKKVERNIHIVEKLVDNNQKNIKYLIVGEGEDRRRLQDLVERLNLNTYIYFIGGMKHESVKNYLAISDFFFSMYDSSNVGNPLLEAIRANKLIITLNNGDTGSWIKHKENGLIFENEQALYEIASKNIIEVIRNQKLKSKIIKGVQDLEATRLWTWEERLTTEVEVLQKIMLEKRI